MKEITFELTSYCEHKCKFCSSNTTDNYKEAEYLNYNIIKKELDGKRFEHIVLSGGEPLAHPDFYKIFKLCEKHTDDVVVYSNLIKHRVYNLHVIDGVYLEAKITPTPETRKIGVLKRITQGRESTRPEVHFSRNHDGDCDCGHMVIIPNGDKVKSPCRKTCKEQ